MYDKLQADETLINNWINFSSIMFSLKCVSIEFPYHRFKTSSPMLHVSEADLKASHLANFHTCFHENSYSVPQFDVFVTDFHITTFNISGKMVSLIWITESSNQLKMTQMEIHFSNNDNSLLFAGDTLKGWNQKFSNFIHKRKIWILILSETIKKTRAYIWFRFTQEKFSWLYQSLKRKLMVRNLDETEKWKAFNKFIISSNRILSDHSRCFQSSMVWWLFALIDNLSLFHNI